MSSRVAEKVRRAMDRLNTRRRVAVKTRASMAWHASALVLAVATTTSSARAAEPATADDGGLDAREENPPEAAAAPDVDRQRELVARYYAGLHVGIDPGIVVGGGKTSFSLAVRGEYGIDTGTVILAPGVELAAYFIDPNAYVGLATLKLAIPIGWFVPFVQGGAGIGHVAAGVTQPSATGTALLGAGGFMIHASPRFAFGVEAGYEAIVGTDFGVVIVAPMAAFAF
jgi:hypothetical protein